MRRPIPHICRPALLAGWVALLCAAAPGAWSAPAAGTIDVDRDGACVAIAGSTPLHAPAGLAVTFGTDPADVPLGRVIISPTRIDVQRALQPGDSFVCDIVIRNRRTTRTTYTLRASGLEGRSTGGVRIVSVDDTDAVTNTAATWLDPVDGSVTVPSRGVVHVPVVVTVPPEPPVGAAYAALTLVPSEATPVAGGGAEIAITEQPAIGFLLRVGGSGKAELHVRDLHAPAVRWNRASWTWRARLTNEGTLHARPTGRVRVRSIFGTTVASFPVATTTLLPGGGTPARVTWRQVPWLGIYRYDARIRSNTPGGSTAVQTGWFVALPPWWVLVLVGALLVGLVAWTVRRRRGDWREFAEDDDTELVD